MGEAFIPIRKFQVLSRRVHGDSQVESRDKTVVELKKGHVHGVGGSLGLGVEANKEALIKGCQGLQFVRRSEFRRSSTEPPAKTWTASLRRSTSWSQPGSREETSPGEKALEEDLFMKKSLPTKASSGFQFFTATIRCMPDDWGEEDMHGQRGMKYMYLCVYMCDEFENVCVLNYLVGS